jgi:hypothetical protein
MHPPMAPGKGRTFQFEIRDVIKVIYLRRSLKERSLRLKANNLYRSKHREHIVRTMKNDLCECGKGHFWVCEARGNLSITFLMVYACEDSVL